jgi:hypothetical protein
MDMVGKDM